MNELDEMDEDGLYTWIERAEELFRSPLYTIFTNNNVEAPEQVADESVLGPIALIRLLVILAKRGTLVTIPQWTQLPSGTSSSTSIGQVKQITNPDIIQKFLVLALKRVAARKETGHERLREGEVEYAHAAYTSAAELAAAIIAFNDVTQHRFAQNTRGVYKELVLCLGNASEDQFLVDPP